MKIYQYLPDLKIVREKPEGENPVFAKSEEDWKLRMKEWTNLKSYPASGFSKEHEGRDLVEGVDFGFELKYYERIGSDSSFQEVVGGYRSVAVPLPSPAVPLEAEAEKPEFLPPDHGDICWIEGAETFTRKEVYHLLWTQRAMIGNDLKSICGQDMTSEMYKIIDNPRIPKF